MTGQLIKFSKLDDFVAKLVHDHKYNLLLSPRAGAIPLIVGAGISAGARIPVDSTLRENISRHMGSAGPMSYEDLYDKIMAHSSTHDLGSLDARRKLQRVLNISGIPCIHDRPSPNVSNLAVLHLLKSSIIGPVISLNVDPLLNIAHRFTSDTPDNEIVFKCNSSQFSGQDRGDGQSRNSIFQVHGSIEEPLSLRFLADEFAHRSSPIMEAAVSGIADAGIILCVGTSFADGFVEKLLIRWASRNVDRNKALHFFATFFDRAPEDKVAEVRSRMQEILGSSAPIEMNIVEGVDADDFFVRFVKRCREEHKRSRGDGDVTYYVPSMTKNLIRAQLYDLCWSETARSQGPAFVALPPCRTAIIIEIILHAIQARGPIALKEVAQASKAFSEWCMAALRADGSSEMNEIMQRLAKSGVIEFPRPVANGWVYDRRPPYLEDVDEIYRFRLVRSTQATDSLAFAHRCFDALGLPRTGFAIEKGLQRLSELAVELERDREEEFSQEQSIPAATYFEQPKVIRSHKLFDAHLDNIKAEFMLHAEQGRKVECYVVTETGEHLFRPLELENAPDLSGQSREQIAKYLRSWISAVYLSGRSDQTINICLARGDSPWLFADPARQSRDKLEEKVAYLLGEIAKVENISISYRPREVHNDHMWYYKLDGGLEEHSKGIYYPTRFDEKLHYALELKGRADIGRLERIRMGLFGLDDVDSYVVALTILDARSLGSGDVAAAGGKMLVCVRRPDTNADHKDVASVPTKRIAKIVYDALVADVEFDPAFGDTQRCSLPYFRDETRFVTSKGKTGSVVLRDVVNDLLSRKFGLGDAIERGLIHFKAKPTVLRRGPSPILASGDSGENIAILNVLVLLDEGAELFPRASASYSNIRWIGTEEFKNAIQRNKPVTFSRGKKFFYGGLCVCTTDVLLRMAEARQTAALSS